MHTYIHSYGREEEWYRFVETLPVPTLPDSILVQVFSSIEEINILQRATDVIHATFPDAAIIGATTAGEIVEGRIEERSIVVAVTFFEKSTVLAYGMEGEESYMLGSALGTKLSTRQAALAILFADGIHHNADSFLEGFTHTFGMSTPIHGGMAADLMRFEKSMVLYGRKWFEGGAVGAVVRSLSLQTIRNYHLSWKAVGKTMRVTKAEGNRVWTLEGSPTAAVYRKYLGIALERDFSKVGSLFPLLMEYEGVTVARAMTGVHEDGSISFAGNVPEGGRVRFGVGNPAWFEEDKKRTLKHLGKREIESLFIYSCAARKHFLGEAIAREFEQFAQMAPVVGFFTYGEFFTIWNMNRALNITTTLLALNEKGTDTPEPKAEEVIQMPEGPEHIALKALIHLINKLEEECRSYGDSTGTT